MLLDVSLDKESLSINIEDPFHLDVESVVGQIEAFTSSKDVSLKDTDIRGLVPRMIRGIAGCEGGCPSDALGLVQRGFKNFQLKYIEGGILSAKVGTDTGKTVEIKMFPDF